MNQSQHPVVQPHEVEASEYRPYKLWLIPGHPSLRIIVVKRSEESCIAACPTMGMRCESTDYLEAMFELSRQVHEALQIPNDVTFASTCTMPFDLTTGKPLSMADAELKVGVRESQSDDEISLNPDQGKTDADPDPEPEPEPKASPAQHLPPVESSVSEGTQNLFGTQDMFAQEFELDMSSEDKL